MKLKRILAGALAGVMAMTSMVVTSVTASAESAIEVTVHTNSDFLSSALFQSADVNVTVAGQAVTGSWWVQTDRQSEGADTVYASAFATSDEIGYKESYTFTTSSASEKVTFIYWSTTHNKNIGMTVTIDTTDAVDGKLSIGLTENGDPATEQSNNWWYETPYTLTVLTEAAPTTYTITCSASESGSVTADKETAAEGETVTLTATPLDGYELESITVNGEAITGTTFEMPAEDVKVVAVFTAVEVDEDAPKFDKDAEDFVTDGDVVTQTKTVDGKTSYRFVKKISKETAEKYTKATITIKDTANNFTADPIDIDYCYSSITASGEKISETDCYFIAYTVTEVPESAELEATIELA